MPCLYIVPTPIGNLEDITFRAVSILREVDMILAEDTRTSGFLLRHLGIDKPMVPYHKFNEHNILEGIISVISRGRSVALVSDAGTPGISDPGFLLVRACVQAGIDVCTLPGPTAFVPALVQSGLPCDTFVFEGFLPHKKGRSSRLDGIVAEHRTTVMYESPYRLVRLLEELSQRCSPERRVAVSREISKKFEQTVRGTVREVLDHFRTTAPKGEFVVVLEGGTNKKIKPDKRNGSDGEDQQEK